MPRPLARPLSRRAMRADLALCPAAPARAAEGTTFEASCYTDPLGIEHITGALAEAIRFFGAWDAAAQLRFTTKYDAVEPLLGLAHNRRTRIRFSVNSRAAERFEGGAPRMPRRLAAMRKALDAHRKENRPTLDTIVERIGPLRNKAASSNGTAGEGRRERRRSRA